MTPPGAAPAASRRHALTAVALQLLHVVVDLVAVVAHRPALQDRAHLADRVVHRAGRGEAQPLADAPEGDAIAAAVFDPVEVLDHRAGNLLHDLLGDLADGEV